MPTDAQIAALIKKISRANLERDVRHLSTAYPTRHTLGKYHVPVSEWLAEQFRARGLRDVRFHEYPQSGKTLRNVIANKAGKPSAKTILVCAHFDSRMKRLSDAEAPAPGANDNATGCAVLLEIVRLLTPLRLNESFRFVFFSGEEEGLWGSRAYAPEVKKSGLDLKFVLNIDQIGYPPADRALFVDRDEGGAVPGNDAASRALVEKIQTLAKTVVKVPTRVDPAYGSDYVPFEAQGYPIVGLYEAGKDYPDYHQSTDTFDKVDFAYVHDMARLSLATLYAESG